MRRLWIVGASSGIGLELVKVALAYGDSVVASAREATRCEVLKGLSIAYPHHLRLIDIDVRYDEEVKLCVEKVWGLFEGIDICLYNAGVYEKMSIEQWDMAHFEQMNQINYMGAVRLLLQLTPRFLEQKRGHFVVNGSIASYFGLPYAGGYSAPKSALLNFCESMHPELREANIYLQIVNHGFVQTRLTAKNDFVMPQLLQPHQTAQKIYDALAKPTKFEVRFPFLLTRLLSLLRMLPYSLSLRLSRSAL
jgi:short-subunit dehydrogenase